jgi:glycosyltransferase involved in cell wall biosynthesis
MALALFSSDYLQINGQALVTRRVAEYLAPRLGAVNQYVYLSGFRARALVSWCAAVARLWRDVVLKRVSTLYIVCSRSNAGFLRDVPALLMARLGVAVIVHAHGSDIVELLTGRMLSPLARWLYAPCTLIIPSSHLVAPLADVRVLNLVVVENFSTAGPPQAVDSAGVAEGPLALLWNSNLMASKGAFDTLKAAALLAGDGVEIDVHVMGALIGDEEMTAECAAAELEALNSLGRICYYGRVSADRARALLMISDVVALPSRYVSECQPLSVIEAMCSGKALIVSDSPALRATISDYPAEVVPVRSVAAIKDALRRLDEEKRADPVAFAARRAAASPAARLRFSVDRFDDEMARLLVGVT